MANMPPLNSIKFAETKYETRKQQRVLFVLIICVTGRVTDSEAFATPISSGAPPSPADELATPAVAVSDAGLTNQTKAAGKSQVLPHIRKSSTTEENEFGAPKVSDGLVLSSQKGTLPTEARSQMPTEETEANRAWGGVQVQTQNPRALEETTNPGLLTWSWVGGETTPANWRVAGETTQGNLAKLTTLFLDVSSFHSGGVNANTEERSDKHSAIQSENTDLLGKGSASATENNHSQSEDVPVVYYSTNFENAEKDSQTSHSEGNEHLLLKKGPDVQIYDQMQPPSLYFVSSNGSHNHEQLNTFNGFQVEPVHDRPNLSGSHEAEKPSYFLSTAADEIKFDMSSHFSANSSAIPNSGKEEEFVKIDIPYSVEEANHELDKGNRIVYGNNHSLPSSVFSNIFEYFDNFYANPTVTSDDDDDDDDQYDDSSDQDYSEKFIRQDEQLPAPMKFSVNSFDDDEHHKHDAHTVNHSTKTVKETSLDSFSQLPDHFSVANDSFTTEIESSYTDQTPIVVGLSVVSPNVLKKISEQLIDTERPMPGPIQFLLRNSTKPQQTGSSEVKLSGNINVRPTVSYELISSSNNNVGTLFGTQNSSLVVHHKTSQSEQNGQVPESSSQSSQNISLQATLLMKPAVTETEPSVTKYHPLNHNETTERVDELSWLPLTTEANTIWSASDAFGIPALNQELSDLTETSNMSLENVTHVNTKAAQTFYSGSGLELTDHSQQTLTNSTSILNNFMNYLLSMNYPTNSEQPSLKPSQEQSNESANYAQNSDHKGLHNSSQFSPVQILNNTFDFSLSSNSTSQENSTEVSDPQIWINNLTTLFSQGQNQGSINSWSLLESLVNSSSYTPPTLDIDCEIFGPLSPIVDFYGNLFPGLENPCKNPSFQKEHGGLEDKVFNGSEEIYLASSPLPNLINSAEENTPTSPVLSPHNLPSHAVASPVNHDYMSNFTDFSLGIVNKTFASLLDETSSAFKNAYPIKQLPLPSETQIEKWWEPLKQITAAPILENIASIINVNIPVFDGEASTDTSAETHVGNEYVDQDDWKNITGKLPSLISEQITESPNNGGVHVSNNLPYIVLPNSSRGDLHTNIAKDKDPEMEQSITTESNLSTALSIVGYKVQPTVTMNPGGGSTIIVKSKTANSNPPEVHIPAPVNVFSHISPASTAPPMKSPSSFWNIFTNPEVVRAFSDAEDPIFHQNSSSEAETSGQKNESSLASSNEPHSNVTEFPLQDSNTEIALNPPEQKDYSHPTTQIATAATAPVSDKNESYESILSVPPSSQHNDSSLPKSSSEDIWTSLYQQWISVSQRNSSLSTAETSTMRSLDTGSTTVSTDLSSHISTFPSLYTATSERTSKKTAQGTVFDETGTRTTAPDLIPSEFAESSVEYDRSYLTETTTEVEFDDVLGSLWELNVKDEKKVKLPENIPAVKFPPVRFTASQAPTRIPLYTVDNLTTTPSSSFGDLSTLSYSVHNKGYTVKDNLNSPYSVQQLENTTSSLKQSPDSSSSDILKTAGTGENEEGKNHGQAASPIKSFVNKVTDQILNLPKLFTGGQNEMKVAENLGSQTKSNIDSLVTAPPRAPYYKGKPSTSASFIINAKYSPAATVSPPPPQIYYPFFNESKMIRHPLLHNHRPHGTYEMSTTTHRPVIIVKKKGNRIHIPVMPSADFSSFKSHKHITPPTRPSSANPPVVVDSKPRNRFLKPQVFSETTRNLPTTSLPAWNSYQNKFPVNVESRNRYSSTTKAPGAADSTPPLRRRGCGSRLLDRLEYLLGRELVMDQMGVGVYSAVVESILSVECGRPEESSRSAPGTSSTTSMAQISPPPPTSSISPTLGMEGWLSLDDIRKEEEEKQNAKTTTSPSDGLVTENRVPSENSLSPVAAALSATSSPMPSHLASSETPPVDFPSFLTASLPPRDGNSSMAVESTALPSWTENSQLNSSSNASFFSLSPTDLDTPTASSVTAGTSTLNSTTLSPEAGLVSSVISLTEQPLLPSRDDIPLPTLSGENSTTAESPAASVQRRSSSSLHDVHQLIRRAVGMAALNSLAVAKALPLDDEDDLEGHMEISSRELGKNVFGFETILTGLVYLSFGIFLYQMIQRAVGAEMMGSPFNNLIRNGGRSLIANGSRLLKGDEPIESYYAVLLKALKQVPEKASKILLEEGKSLELQARSPSCLPLYLCRVTSRRFHQKELENEADSGSSAQSSVIHHALFTSAVRIVTYFSCGFITGQSQGWKLSVSLESSHGQDVRICSISPEGYVFQKYPSGEVEHIHPAYVNSRERLRRVSRPVIGLSTANQERRKGLA